MLGTLCKDKDIDISMAFSLAEEEEETHKQPIEVVTEFFAEKNEVSLFLNQKNYGKITSDFLLKHDNGFTEIISPPPDFSSIV